jgi:Short C-terminal domain
VRWILPGQLDAAIAGWFRRFPAETESREDAYLIQASQDDRINQLEQQQAPPPQAAPAAGPSMADQLQQIAALHQQGVLTDEEFAAAKSKLLGS